MSLTSAAGLVSLLDDKRPDVKGFALTRLNDLVEEFWAEISEFVGKIEILHEDPNFKFRKMAALLASKVYYYLAEYEDALHFALCAEELFDVNSSTEFIETLISKCIDKYIELKAFEDFTKTGQVVLHKKDSIGDRSWSVNGSAFKKLEQVVDRMFERCFEHKQYKQALGMAIETRRLDVFEKSILSAEDREGMLRYAYRVVLTLVDSVHLRDQLLRILVSIYTDRPSPTDAINVCQCLVLIDDPKAASSVMEELLLLSAEATVTAYQIGFDLYENATQNFLERLCASLTRSQKLAHLMTPSKKEPGNTVEPASTEAAVNGTCGSEQPNPTADGTEKANEGQGTATAIAVAASVTLSEADEEIKKRLTNLLSILSGDKTVEFHLQFLIRNKRADLRLLERIRDDARNSVTHNAATLANGFMYCGTTWDQFLRGNLAWLGKAVNWAKFTATSTLGVIHKGHEKQALKLMSAYLPKDASGSSGSVYTEGGGLFALGLIHANHGGTMIEYLLNQSKEATAEPVRHGACLGLGLAAMGTGRADVYDQMKLNLYQDDAITGEAAGIGMGLVMLGTGSAQAVEDLLSYAKDTAHEKIIRGIALGIAMVMYGRLEEADDLIERLSTDNDPILRWCGMATIAMAYCGSGSNKAVQKLLHAAVSDTSDDVRRWAVTALGFILFKTPEQVPAVVSLLTESYHPHLQFGAAMAMGVACAGTALKEALTLLESLYDGPNAFVRQGALVATALILIQQNGVTCPKSLEFREKCFKIISDRHEDLLTKFGAILACGIIDAGGCNMTISLQTRTGNNNMVAAVGLLVFQNFWFWYPLANFISLAFTPTALIALNKDLKMPKMQFRSNAKPSTFAYPQSFQPEKEKKREKVETAVLSFTAKQRKKEADRKQHREQQQQRKESTATAGAREEQKMEVDVAPAKPKPTEEKEEKEPTFSMLSNPARVMWAQQRVMGIPDSARYYTIKPVTQSGILMVHDRRPQEVETLVEMRHGHGPIAVLERPTGSYAGTDGATGGPAGTSGSLAPVETPMVHASAIGAYLDVDDDDDDDEEVEDEEEDSSGEPHDADEEEADRTPAITVIETSDVHMTEDGAKPSNRRQGKRPRATGVKPPGPFQYLEEGGGPLTAGTSQSTSAAEPMDHEVQLKKSDDKKPSTAAKDDSSKE